MKQKKAIFEYNDRGIFVRRLDEETLQGTVNEERTYIARMNKPGEFYKIKTIQTSDYRPGQVVYFKPARKWRGEQWAKEIWERNPPPQHYNPFSIPHGLLIARSQKKNIGYAPGPKGGQSFKRRTNKWSRYVYALWDDKSEESIEEFNQAWWDKEKPKDCRQGKGVRTVSIEFLIDRLEREMLVPFNSPEKSPSKILP